MKRIWQRAIYSQNGKRIRIKLALLTLFSSGLAVLPEEFSIIYTLSARYTYNSSQYPETEHDGLSYSQDQYKKKFGYEGLSHLIKGSGYYGYHTIRRHCITQESTVSREGRMGSSAWARSRFLIMLTLLSGIVLIVYFKLSRSRKRVPTNCPDVIQS